MAASKKPTPDDPKDLARAIFRDADRKLAAKNEESETKRPYPDTSTVFQPSD